MTVSGRHSLCGGQSGNRWTYRCDTTTCKGEWTAELWPAAAPVIALGDAMTTLDTAGSNARELWLRYEVIHDLAYFAPEVLSRATALGMRGFWMGYFAMRSAPLGVVHPLIVTATFFGFHHSRVARALPDAWNFTNPEGALEARLSGIDDALAGFVTDGRALDEAADLLWSAAQSVDTAGRPLAAAYQALAKPRTPTATLWQSTAVMREHRGDGHVAALVANGLTPAEAHQLKVAAGESDAEALRTGRGFPADEWRQGTDALAARGWVDDTQRLTEAGWQAHLAIEAATDALAAQPWRTLGPAATRRLLDLLDPLARKVFGSGLIPRPNPVGLVWQQA
jgi:hypothetical protein